jgi:hypothetical protein
VDKQVRALRTAFQYRGSKGFEAGNNSVVGFAKDDAARKKAEADATKRAKELAKLAQGQVKAQKALTAEQKKQALAKKQSALFDLDQIQLVAALKGNLSKEEELRVKLQLALLTDNTTEADKLSQRLAMSIDSTGQLAAYLRALPDAKNPFLGWDTWLKTFAQKLADVTGSKIPTDTGIVTPKPMIPSTNVTTVPNAPRAFTGEELGSFLGSGRGTNDLANNRTIVVQIDGREIASVVQNQGLQGNNPIINRLGSFS